MSAKQFGTLGKGLESLLSDSNFEEENEAKNSNASEILVDVNKLKPNPFQPRTEFSSDALEELSESIKIHGIIQPILAEAAENGEYYIIAGERRTRAAQLAGLTQVPVILRNFNDEKKLEVALIENIQRENLNPMEEAKAYQRIMQLENIGQEEAAKKVGKNRSTVANALRLLKLPEDMQNALASGTISAGHARALLSVNNPSDMRILFARMTGSGMSVREAEQYASELNGNAKKENTKPKETKTPKDPDLAFIEQQFIDALGTKVSLKGNMQRGSIQIEYFSNDELDRLYNILLKNE